MLQPRIVQPVASMIFGKMFWRVRRDFVPKGSPGGLSFLVTTLPLGGGKDHDGFLLRRDAATTLLGRSQVSGRAGAAGSQQRCCISSVFASTMSLRMSATMTVL